MKTQVVLFLSLFLFCSFSLLAHQGKNKGNLQDTITNHQHAKGEQHEHGNDTMEEGNPQAYDHPQKITADFEDFPNLHPLVVHVPIMMLPLAATLQLIGFFVFKREISWIVLGILIFRFLGLLGQQLLPTPMSVTFPNMLKKFMISTICMPRGPSGSVELLYC